VAQKSKGYQENEFILLCQEHKYLYFTKCYRGPQTWAELRISAHFVSLLIRGVLESVLRRNFRPKGHKAMRAGGNWILRFLIMSAVCQTLLQRSHCK
jgi:hypothetical protein